MKFIGNSDHPLVDNGNLEFIKGESNYIMFSIKLVPSEFYFNETL